MISHAFKFLKRICFIIPSKRFLSVACSLVVRLNWFKFFSSAWDCFSDISICFKVPSFVNSKLLSISRFATALDRIDSVIYLFYFGSDSVSSSSCFCFVSSSFVIHLWLVRLKFLVKYLPLVSQTYPFPKWAIRLWRIKFDRSVYFLAQRSQAFFSWK